ncbi:hypothetical protein KRR40_39125 [Niabella defluvii]|nr:hypothetical protein KRR40_39125 [Niabella sp. I65]
MKQSDTNSIRYPREVDVKMEKLAQQLRRSKKDLFCQMVDYFYRSKKILLIREMSCSKGTFSRDQPYSLLYQTAGKGFSAAGFTDTGLLKTAASRQITVLIM